MTASPPRSILPPLTPEEQRHSRALAALIHGELRAAGGWLSFERFMELALYAPGLGYYSAGSTKLGAGGDFVTAPEVSDLFGRCLARQCAAVLAVTGGDILELGAGTGRLAAALLGELATLGVLPERYAILEVSADLAARQRARLAQLPPALRERVVWLEGLPQRPLTGVMLANEVADALPCRRFSWRASGVTELGIEAAGSSGEAVSWCERGRSADAALTQACAALLAGLPAPLPQGYTSEVCLRVAPWIASLSDCLGRGLLLLCDYGLPRSHYYHPQRVSGTLRCHFRQRAHADPYINVGVQDITAWVDFTRVAEAAAAVDLDVGGFATQAAFLLALGIEQLVAAAPPGATHARLAGEARRLLMPEEMGEAFKAMALTRGIELPLAGFALQDLRHLL
ncbi:MAG TPA: SAM-dependent methyltransferase [Steroidobacteraceae bacterium]|jgi:SAM-dependent MidA family methyltransferase|nr:SAM-dependent methyltransferase [Steroidobacteraceae bacterium]